MDGCIHNYIARRHRVQLYKIPRDTTIARKWLDACGFEDLQISSSTSTFKVCREHFTSNDFEGPTTLRPDAVPSLFTTHSRSLMDKQNSSPTKRFRSDLTNNRAKQTIPNNNNKQRTSQLSYRNSNNYQRQQENQIVSSSSPIQENSEENNKQIIYDMDLNMNCFEEQLSESQISHCPVKVKELFLVNQSNFV